MDLIKLQTYGTVITSVMPDSFSNDVLEHSVVVFEVERKWLEQYLTGDDLSVDEYVSSYDWNSSEVVFEEALASNALKTLSFTYHHL